MDFLSKSEYEASVVDCYNTGVAELVFQDEPKQDRGSLFPPAPRRKQTALK